MNVGQLKELLVGHSDSTEIKLGGWVTSPNAVAKYNYDYEPLSEKHFAFDKNLHGKVTILVELDV